MWKRILLIGSILIFLSGCSIQTNEQEKLRDLEYTIVEEGKAPEGLEAILEGGAALPVYRLWGAEYKRLQHCSQRAVSFGKCHLF